MAFPTDETQVMLAFALREIQATASSLKKRSIALKATTSSGPTNATSILEYHRELKAKMDRMNFLASTPGMAQYAKDQFDDQLFDVVAEFNAMTLAFQDTLDWIRTNLPVSAGGFVEEKMIEADDSVTAKTFTVGQTAGLRSQLDDLIATIN